MSKATKIETKSLAKLLRGRRKGGKLKADTGKELPENQIRLRSEKPRNQNEADISRDGGQYGAGQISGVSLATVGEALGHYVWMDRETLAQIAEMANEPPNGLKSRFTHPGMSSDGMGRFLGRIKETEVIEDQAIGDLHLSMSAHNTPDGDLADYTMQLAEEDPQAAGLSIVFEYDYTAMTEFGLANGCEINDHGWVDWDGFESPDPDNTENYPHVRLSELRAADIVDEPAANPEGLFDRQSEPRDADKFLLFAAGISDDKPSNFRGIDPGRARAFMGRWLESNGLQLSKTNEEPPEMDDQNKKDAAPPAETREQFQAELDKFTAAFGGENGSKWFSEGISFEEAQGRHLAALQAENDSLKKDLDAEREKLASLSNGEEEEVDTAGDGSGKSRVDFSDFFAHSSKN